jgi:hypothetical protein
MTKRVILSVVLLVAGLAAVALPQGEDPGWGEQRKVILLGDLKAEVGLTDGQMTALDGLCLAHRTALIAKAQEIGLILQQIRVLSQDWQANFTQITHLQFQLDVKEFEVEQLRRAFSEDVDGILTAEQAGYKPLVMKVLDEAYVLHPRSRGPRDGSEGGDSGKWFWGPGPRHDGDMD